MDGVVNSFHPQAGSTGSRHRFWKVTAPIMTGLESYRQAVLPRSKPTSARRNAAGLDVAFRSISPFCCRQDATRQRNAYTPSTEEPRTDTHQSRALAPALALDHLHTAIFDGNPSSI